MQKDRGKFSEGDRCLSLYKHLNITSQSVPQATHVLSQHAQKFTNTKKEKYVNY